MDSIQAGWPFAGGELDELRRHQREVLLALPRGELARVVDRLSPRRPSSSGSADEGKELAVRREIAQLLIGVHSELVEALLRGRAASQLLGAIVPLLEVPECSEFVDTTMAKANADLLPEDFFIEHEATVRLLAGLLFVAEQASDDGWTYDRLPN